MQKLKPKISVLLAVIVGFICSVSIPEVSGITCYICSPHKKNLCNPLELYGNETQCPEGINICYKSWSVEADPKTVRRCGSRTDIPNNSAECRERLQGADKVLVCKCDTDLCNGVDRVTTKGEIFAISVLPMLYLKKLL